MAGKHQYGAMVYNILINPRYRVWRHILLIIAMFFISLNQIYSYFIKVPDNFTFLILYVSCTALSYIGVVYYNIYLAIPRYLYKKKYKKYLTSIILSVFILTGIGYVWEYLGYKILKLPVTETYIFNPDNSIMLDFIFTSSLLGLCVIGSTSTSLLRQWETDRRNILELKNDYLQSEIEQLKERISPEFLLNVLNKSARISVDNPETASLILVKLSQVLRYQLYDCSHRMVLLNSEIAFINNYLDLYQSHNNKLEYRISADGDILHKFVPPLLFLPLIQIMTGNRSIGIILNIRFIVTDSFIGFLCAATNENSEYNMNDPDLSHIHYRLKQIYKESYRLIVSDKHIMMQLNII